MGGKYRVLGIPNENGTYGTVYGTAFERKGKIYFTNLNSDLLIEIKCEGLDKLTSEHFNQLKLFGDFNRTDIPKWSEILRYVGDFFDPFLGMESCERNEERFKYGSNS